MRQTSRWALNALLSAGLVCVGCDDSTAPIPPEIVGTYTLVSIDAQALPAPLGPQNSGAVTAVGGSLILREDGEYLQLIQTRVVSASGGSQTGNNATQGSFSVNGNRIELHERLGPSREGSVNQGTIRYNITAGQQTIALEWRR